MFVQYTLVHIRSYKHSLHRVVDRQCLPRSRHYIPSCSRYQRNPSCKYHNTRSSCCNSLCRPNSFRCIVSHTGLHNSHLCTRHRFQYFFHSSIGFQLSHSYCYKSVTKVSIKSNITRFAGTITIASITRVIALIVTFISPPTVFASA